MQETHLMRKYKQNLKSAKMLIDNEFYASSVHCSYYALFQFMLCKINQYAKMSFEEIALSMKGKDSHNGTKEKLMSIIRKENVSSNLGYVQIGVLDYEFIKLRRKIDDLKTFRRESDYQNCKIDEQKGIDSLKVSQEVIEKINEYLP